MSSQPTTPAVAGKAGEGSQAPVIRQEPPPPGPVKDARFPAVTRSTLDNGLRIIVVEHHALPVVYAAVHVRAGAASDPADRHGVAGFLTEMLLEGTRKRSKQQIVEEIEFVGGEIGSGCDEDRCSVRVAALKDHVGIALGLLADVAMSPAFSKQAVEKIRDKQLSDLKRELTDPGFLARRAFVENLYGEAHPYGHIAPSEESLKAMTRADLVNFHERYFGPSNAFVVVAGDVEPRELIAAAKKAFGGWKSQVKPAVEPPAPGAATNRRIVIVDRPGSVQATFYLGMPAVRRNDPSWIGLVVGNQVLGGSASSRLFLRLREEKSLTYGAYSRLEPRRGIGYASASANCRNEVAGEAMKEFLAEMARFRDQAVPDKELGNSKSYLDGLFPTQVETASNVGAMAAQLELYGLPEDYWDVYRSRVLSVSDADARAFARYLDPDRVLITVVGDAGAIKGQLMPFGTVTVIDTDGKKLN